MSDFKTPEEKKLADALARIIQLEATMLVVAKHSNRDRDRIIELENELGDWHATFPGKTAQQVCALLPAATASRQQDAE